MDNIKVITMHRKMVTFTKKGETRWETKAEKRIKTKAKSRKSASRPKRRREKIAEALSSAEVVGFA